ncbi:hypothetical protein BSKO_10105 [Bryopsis sp. KO-2023]|nr:hypothetical protein BSKO_10105 [Bryopsis sp. KO-2023]
MLSQAHDFRVICFAGLLLICGCALVEGRRLSGDGTSASDIMLQLTGQTPNAPADPVSGTAADSGGVQYGGMVAMYAFQSRSEFGQEPLVVETAFESTPSPPAPSESTGEGEEIVEVEVETPVEISDRIMSLDGLDVPCDSDRIFLMPRAVQEKCHKEADTLNDENGESSGGEDSEGQVD